MLKRHGTKSISMETFCSGMFYTFDCNWIKMIACYLHVVCRFLFMFSCFFLSFRRNYNKFQFISLYVQLLNYFFFYVRHLFITINNLFSEKEPW